MVFLACYVCSLTELVDEVLLMSFITFYICLLNLYLRKTQFNIANQHLFSFSYSSGINFLSLFKNSQCL